MTGGIMNMGQKVYSFPRGGITFTDSTVPPRDKYVTAFLPSLSVIPLIQHSGGRSYPVVNIGDLVREGMLIARGRGPGSANIHATVPGRIIRMASWKDANGNNRDAIVIRMEGNFEKLGKQEEVFSWEGMFPHDIQRTISDFGIVEMDGRGRPVSEIISSMRSAPEPVTLVVRCVLDDPWLASDFVLCNERTAAIVEGAAITARTCRVSRIIFAISHKERALVDKFLSFGDKCALPLSAVLVGSKYPQRNNREIELVLKNYAKKEGIELGSLLVFGPATLAAIYDAVKLRKPVLERFITVGGSAIKTPQVMKVRIGKRIGDIFAECGGFKGTPRRIATGSPLLGQLLADLDEPVIKTSYAIFALLEGRRRETRSNCINCGECRNVCPLGLDPEELYKKALFGRVSNLSLGISFELSEECHACGCCEIVCPSHLPLSTVILSHASGVNP